MSASLYFVTQSAKSILVDNELNMGDSNCRAVLVALGYDAHFEVADKYPIGEFEDALRRFQGSEIASLVDQGREGVDYAKLGLANITDCGRRAGYLAEKVAIALQMVEEAKSKGAVFCYFS